MAKPTLKTVRSVKAVKAVKAGSSRSSVSSRSGATKAAKSTKTVKKATPAKHARSKTMPAKTVPAKKAAAKTAPRAAKAAKSAKSTKSAKAPAKVATKAPAKATKAKASAAAKKAGAGKAPAKAGKATAKPVKAVKAVKGKVVKGPPALVPKPAPSRPVLSEVVARRHRSPAVAASTMDRLRIQLIEEMAQHTRQAEGLQAEAEALANEREPGDTQFDEESGEGDTLSVERERDLALSASARQTVEDITKALARMDDGTYGYCEVCGDRIPVPRLEAIPWADQCVKCKSRGERRR
jgi:RNA polymerase-binding protein DksA